jgi:tRNA nucleotidyltransferase (CCA-adding enzyme)
MKEYLNRLPQDIMEIILRAQETSTEVGCRVFLVGGFVRDLILGVKNFDVDMAVESDGIKFAHALGNKIGAQVIAHRRFGTATLLMKPHGKIDIATTRNEDYPHPASLPEVREGHLEDDLLRRDFTINALAINISAYGFGTLIDVCGGKGDLSSGKIRVLHERSFIDDPTRILRAVRFEQRYDFRIEPKTLALLKAALHQSILQRVQPQRLRDELILILKERCPLRTLARLRDLRCLGFISPHFSLPQATRRLFSAIDQEVAWFAANHYHRRHLDVWVIYLIALLQHRGGEQVKSICDQFVFRKSEAQKVFSFKRFRPAYVAMLSQRALKPSRIYKVLERLSYEEILLLRAKYRNKVFRQHLEEFISIHNEIRIAVSGHDLHGLGVLPGPAYSRIFKKVLDARLDGKLHSRHEELMFVRKLAKPYLMR